MRNIVTLVIGSLALECGFVIGVTLMPDDRIMTILISFAVLAVCWAVLFLVNRKELLARYREWRNTKRLWNLMSKGLADELGHIQVERVVIDIKVPMRRGRFSGLILKGTIPKSLGPGSVVGIKSLSAQTIELKDAYTTTSLTRTDDER